MFIWALLITVGVSLTQASPFGTSVSLSALDGEFEPYECISLLRSRTRAAAQIQGMSTRDQRQVIADQLLMRGESYGLHLALTEAVRDAVLRQDFARAAQLKAQAFALLRRHGKVWIPPLAQRHAGFVVLDIFGQIRGLAFHFLDDLATYEKLGGQKEFTDFGLSEVRLNIAPLRGKLSGVLKRVLQWPALTRLRLDRPGFDAVAWDALADSHLEALALSSVVGSPPENFRFPQTLRDLSLTQMEDTPGLLRLASKLPNLQRVHLAVEAEETPILREIQLPPSLGALEISGFELDIASVRAIAYAPHLRSLRSNGPGRLANPAFLGELAHSRSLEKVHLLEELLPTQRRFGVSNETLRAISIQAWDESALEMEMDSEYYRFEAELNP